MKETIHMGPGVWKDMLGNVTVTISNIAPQFEDAELKKISMGKPRHIETIGGWKKRFGGTKANFKHPFTDKSFDFDFRHWEHLVLSQKKGMKKAES